MIEIRFNRQGLTAQDKLNYARIFKKIIPKLGIFNKYSRLFKQSADIEIRIIFR
ncbi:MAG: hypothetical protein KJ915_00760 [Candidatus Omnitrophica bacterium]|nr:hypothetical protein [Candidatus Omnitrophota bacterium]